MKDFDETNYDENRGALPGIIGMLCVLVVVLAVALWVACLQSSCEARQGVLVRGLYGYECVVPVRP